MRPHNLNGGRPKFVPTKEQQSDVRALASCGNSQAVIANYLHISINTLKLHFAEELSAAAIKANQAVAINLFRIATRGSGAAAVSAIKYWLNSRAKDLWGLREPVSVSNRTGLRPAEMEIGKWRSETGARNSPLNDRNAKNCRSETGARQPNPRECRGFSHTGEIIPGDPTPFEPRTVLPSVSGRRL
jgi:hypothetical protein